MIKSKGHFVFFLFYLPFFFILVMRTWTVKRAKLQRNEISFHLFHIDRKKIVNIFYMDTKIYNTLYLMEVSTWRCDWSVRTGLQRFSDDIPDYSATYWTTCASLDEYRSQSSLLIWRKAPWRTLKQKWKLSPWNRNFLIQRHWPKQNAIFNIFKLLVDKR